MVLHVSQFDTFFEVTLAVKSGNNPSEKIISGLYYCNCSLIKQVKMNDLLVFTHKQIVHPFFE